MWLFRSLSAILSSLSLIMLVRLGFELNSFSLPLEKIVQSYEAIMQFLLGWAEPLISPLLDQFSAVFSIQLELYPHWKHALVLPLLYWAAVWRFEFRRWSDQFSSSRSRFRKIMSPRSAAVLRRFGFDVPVYKEVPVFISAILSGRELTEITLSIFIATMPVLVASIMVGTVPLQSSDMLSQFLIVGVVITGFWLSRSLEFVSRLFLGSILKFRRPYLYVPKFFKTDLLYVVGGLALGSLTLLWAPVRDSGSPGLVILGIMFVLVAVYDFFPNTSFLFWDLVRKEKGPTPLIDMPKYFLGTLRDDFSRRIRPEVGEAMLTGFFGVALFFATDAGMRQFSSTWD